jgi:hypothetical protein
MLTARRNYRCALRVATIPITADPANRVRSPKKSATKTPPSMATGRIHISTGDFGGIMARVLPESIPSWAVESEPSQMVAVG